MMFMTDAALKQFQAGKGWEVGLDGNVALINIGGGERVDFTKLNDLFIAFVFDVKGLMADISLKGEVITPAIKYVQCGPITHRRGGLSAAAHRNHPFNEPSYGSKPASYGSGQPRRTGAHAAASRLCLSAVPLDGLGAWQDHLKNWLRCAAAESPPRRTSAQVEPVYLPE
jgi:hypothetical protein